MPRIFLFAILILSQVISAQDSTKSLAIKPTKIYFSRPLVLPKNGGFPLLAAYVLTQQAKDGDVFSQHELGIRYLLNIGFPADTALAAYWIKKAADQNLPAAKMNFGIMENNGIGVEWNPFKAYENFKYAAYNGVADAQFAYGIFLVDNLVVGRNMSEAYVWIKKAADQGVEGADKVLKKLEEKGITAPDSMLTEIDKKMTKAPENSGQATIMSQNFDLDYFDFTPDSSKDNQDEVIEGLLKLDAGKLKELLGIEKIEEKDTTAINLIKLGAKNGSPEALYILGRMYEKGKLLKKDKLMALQNYLRSYRLGSFKSVERILDLIKDREIFAKLKTQIDAGNSDAMFDWAALVAFGFDNQLTEKQAFEMLLKSGELNNVTALVETGLCYNSGTLVKEDRAKANEFWSKAAELGSREALVRMSFANIFREEGSYELQKNSFNLLLQAANEGSVLGQTYVAYCYEMGKGTDKNKASAAEYYRKASQRGNETAYESLKRMYDELRPDDPEFKIY